MAERWLEVTFERRLMGLLSRRDDDTLAFEYSASWLASSDSFPLSHSLPLTDGRCETLAVSHFFGNLLPEGQVRQLVTRRLGISEDNDFELLALIGGDCAGAISVTPSDSVSNAADGYRTLTEHELASLGREQTFAPLLVGEQGVRLSLAGAQDKLPVKILDGQILIPLGQAASTHILKLPSARFKHLTANEALVCDLARRVGLPGVEAMLLRPMRGLELFAVTRYDRLVTETGAVRRLHQEDLCQALGQGASRKYESEGGPSFASCYELVTQVSTNPLADGKSLLDWLVFNGAVGNCDGHAKNLSLLFQPSGGCMLAPFYDLLSTRAYPRLSRSMAMAVGGGSDSGKLIQRHWLRLADDIGVGVRFLLDNARHLAEAVLQQLEPAAISFRELHGAHPVLQLVVPVIRKQAKMILRSLAE